MSFNRREFLAAVPAGLTVAKAAVDARREHVLWYRKPATKWVEALPVGNGRMGAMIFGGIAEEHLQLNEDSVWTGARGNRINPAAAAAVPEVRRLLSANRIKEA